VFVAEIRAFCIIAHVDHGKSTLADRLIQKTLGVPDREFHDQLLDTMELERERGITIKSQAVALPYRAKDGRDIMLHLIDTPGHVDFSYEVSRALASCEGALLLVDASQGVEAQTVANLYIAVEHDLAIVPVINKIDLPSADVESAREQIDADLGLDPDEALLCSGKTGQGVEELLEAIVARIPAPQVDVDAPLQARIFDSVYDVYRGVVVFARLVSGSVKPGDRVRFWSTEAVRRVEEVGFLQLGLVPQKRLVAGEAGYIIAGVKSIRDARNGDTITNDEAPCVEPLPGFREVKPVVFSSIYPVSTDDYEDLAEAMDRLRLNDASLVFQKDSSAVLGQGFRCGFLGLLHLDIIQERLTREFEQSLILTAPSVRYEVYLKDGTMVPVDNPAHFPDPVYIDHVEEPRILASFIVPNEYIGNVINLCLERRGTQRSMDFLDSKRVELKFDLPLAEVLFDFYDRLKSISRGYASFDYEFLEYRRGNVVKVQILVNHEPVDALALLVSEDRAIERSRTVCERLAETIPRHQFKIPIQAAIGGKIIARETIGAFRKDVTAKCYGGDISRKRKLLEKQKKGKKRMMQVGEVVIPQEAFLAALSQKPE
jgi:GTP-binding protein LepA